MANVSQSHVHTCQGCCSKWINATMSCTTVLIESNKSFLYVCSVLLCAAG